MPRPARGTKKSTWVVMIVLGLFMAVVIYRSFQISTYQCEVCISFRGNSVCRTVEGANELDARRAAVTNVCADLSSGVTDSMACERTEPTKVQCAAKG